MLIEKELTEKVPVKKFCVEIVLAVNVFVCRIEERVSVLKVALIAVIELTTKLLVLIAGRKP